MAMYIFFGLKPRKDRLVRCVRCRKPMRKINNKYVCENKNCEYEGIHFSQETWWIAEQLRKPMRKYKVWLVKEGKKEFYTIIRATSKKAAIDKILDILEVRVSPRTLELIEDVIVKKV